MGNIPQHFSHGVIKKLHLDKYGDWISNIGHRVKDFVQGHNQSDYSGQCFFDTLDRRKSLLKLC